jgi:hypothetical protein
VLVAGALALTLVVGATSGAVAGALITSKDIKDNTIRSRDLRTNAVKNSDISAGAVNWDKSLDQATKDQIEALIDEGAAGHAGPAGPAGPPGKDGRDGSDATGGQLVALDYFNGDVVFADGSLPIARLVGRADPITITTPGNYIVTMRAGASLPDFGDDGPDLEALFGSLGLLTLGAPITIEEGEGEDPDVARLDTDVLSRSCLNLVVICNATFSVTVQSGAPLQLDPQLLTLADPCVTDAVSEDADCRIPARVRVEVYRLAGPTADWSAEENLPVIEVPIPDCCAKRVRNEIRGMVRQFAQ